MEEESIKKLEVTKKLAFIDLFSCYNMISFPFYYRLSFLTEMSNKLFNFSLVCMIILFIVTLIYMGIIDNKKNVYEGSILDNISSMKITHLVRFTFMPTILLGIFSLVCSLLEKNFGLNFDKFVVVGVYIVIFAYILSCVLQIHLYSKIKAIYVIFTLVLTFAIELLMVAFYLNSFIMPLGTALLLSILSLITLITISKNI